MGYAWGLCLQSKRWKIAWGDYHYPCWEIARLERPSIRAFLRADTVGTAPLRDRLEASRYPACNWPIAGERRRPIKRS